MAVAGCLGVIATVAVFVASGRVRRVVPEVGVRLLVAQGYRFTSRPGAAHVVVLRFPGAGYPPRSAPAPARRSGRRAGRWPAGAGRDDRGAGRPAVRWAG